MAKLKCCPLCKDKLDPTVINGCCDNNCPIIFFENDSLGFSILFKYESYNVEYYSYSFHKKFRIWSNGNRLCEIDGVKYNVVFSKKLKFIKQQIALLNF